MGEKIFGKCPNCCAERNAEILAEDKTDSENREAGIWWQSSYAILRCLGCDCRYIRHTTACSEDADPETGDVEDVISYWPSPISRSRPRWLWIGFESDYPSLSELLSELYAALDADLHTLATMGMRTAFECSCDLLGVDTTLSFADKLKELVANGKIGIEEKEILGTLIDAGNGAMHRGWKPTSLDIGSLVQVLENFIERAFVLKHEIRHVKVSIPPRGKRQRN